MKNILNILFILLLATLSSLGVIYIIESRYDYRDVNKDGKISTQDVSIIKAYLLEKQGECNYEYK